MNIVITGGAGYISANLIRKLNEDNHRLNITVIDNFYNDSDHKRKLVNEYQNKYSVKYIENNIGNIHEYINDLPEQIDLLINMASLNSRYESDANKEKYLKENFLNLNSFLLTLEKTNRIPKKMLLTSTRGIYGNGLNNTQKESDIPTPVSYYGYTKLLQEQAVKIFAEQNNIDTYIFRIANVFGENQSKFYTNFGVISMLMNKIAHGKKITLDGNGDLVRDYIHIDDVVEVIYQAIKKDTNAVIKTFNLGTGKGYTMKEITEMIKLALENQIEIEYRDYYDDVLNSVLNTDNLQSTFKIDQFKSIEDYIKNKQFINS